MDGFEFVRLILPHWPAWWVLGFTDSEQLVADFHGHRGLAKKN
jgi:hypothetical protein